jgi:multicomponent Na+:H+ antiporter subunit D
LSGSFRGDPPLFFGFLIASVAVVGIPPTILFQAKFRLYELVLAEVMGSGSIYYALALVVMLLGSLLALAGFLKVVQTTYLTPGESVMKSPKYLSVLIGILGIATIVLGLTYTSVENEVIRRVANSFLAGRMEYINEVIKLLSSG